MKSESGEASLLVPPISIAHESLASFRIPTQRPAPLILRQGFYCPWWSSPWAHFRAYPSNLACPLLPIARREANPFSSYCHAKACCLWLLTVRSLHRSRNLLSWYPGKYWQVVARGASSKLFQNREIGWAHEGLGGAWVWVSLRGRGEKHLLSCARTILRWSGLPDRYCSAACEVIKYDRTTTWIVFFVSCLN